MPLVILSFTISSGTNVKEATAAIESSQFRMIMADDLDDAALKAVRIADITKQVCARIRYYYSNKHVRCFEKPDIYIYIYMEPPPYQYSLLCAGGADSNEREF